MTLIELVIGISIVVIISTMCFIRLNIDEFKIVSFSKQLCSDIRYVRNENMLSDLTVYVNLFQEEGRSGYSLHKNKLEDKKIYLPKNVNLSYPAGGKIQLKRDGSFVQGGGTISIISKKESRYITIVPVSGRVL